MRNLVNIILIVLCAWLLGISFYDYHFSFIPWIMVAPFLFLLYKCRSRLEAFFLSFLFGSVFYGTVFFWITIVKHWVGSLGYLGWIGVFLYLAMIFSVAGIILYELGRGAWSGLVLVAPIWVVLEWLQAKGMFGITAASLAYSQDAASLIGGAARYGGIYLISFMIIMSNTLILLALFLFDKRRIGSKMFNPALGVNEGKALRAWYLMYGAGVILLLLSFFVYLYVTGDSTEYEQSDYSAAIIQPNVSQDKKLSYKYAQLIFNDLRFNMGSIVNVGPDLYFFPESLIPGVFERNFFYYYMLASYIKKGDAMIFGSDRLESGKYYNSVYSMNSKGNASERYDKERLVPFGEYIPFRSFISALLPQTLRYMDADISAGKGSALFLLKGKYPYGVSVCFESIFPDVFYKQSRAGSRFFVVLTNDGWFFDTIALKLHRNATAYRALESGSQVFFCANTGESGVIMPNGKIIRSISYNKRDFIKEKIVFNKGLTVYYRFYDWLIYLSMLFIGGFILVGLRKKKDY